MKANGTAARNRNDHFGKPAAAINNCPQSQIVPSTSPSSMTSTSNFCGSEATITPERSESPLVPPCGPAADSLRGPPCCVLLLVPDETGSCDASVLILRSTAP